MPERSPAARRGERGRAGIIFAVLGVIVIALVGSGVGTVFYARDQLEPPSEAHGKPVALEVRSGEGLDDVIADLSSQGLIRSPFWFGHYARFKGLGEHLKMGRFMLDEGMAAGTIIAVLQSEPTPTRRNVALAEGLSAEQMGHVIGRAGVGITQEQYLAEVRSGVFAAPFLAGRPAGSSLEGFLFPDTYDVPEHSTAHDVVQMQLDNFNRRAVVPGEVPSTGAYPIVVLASLVEREAKFAADRPLVAGVISNRLARRMNLQIDAAVLYGLHRIGRDGTTVDTETDTPYNTYLHPGLPPTPIANPGAEALAAAAHPPSTPYLFYVSDGCGHNHYSATVAEHDRSVAQYVGKPCLESPAPEPSPGG
ncbi:MAG: endolytic transglycosylase MltG [Candidatus Dormibacteria bacterium]